LDNVAHVSEPAEKQSENDSRIVLLELEPGYFETGSSMTWKNESDDCDYYCADCGVVIAHQG